MRAIRRLMIPLLVLIFMASLAWLAYAQAGDGFEIPWSSVDGGGGISTDGNFTLGAAIGQPDAGQMSGGDYELQGGFWQCLTDAVTATGIASGGTDVQLSWSAAAAGANVYRGADDPYFVPGSPYASGVTSTWTDSGAAGDPGTNYTYVIRADGDCGESGNSVRLGEFDFPLLPGSVLAGD
jgi:hypothetical protein